MEKGKEYYNFIYKIALCLCILSFIPLNAYAASLMGINVQQNLNNSYNIILKLEGETKINKVINSSDAITLTLNAASPSDNIEIVYDNTPNLYNVIVKKKNSNNTVVFLEGKNISNAAIYKGNIDNNSLTPFNQNSLFFGVNNKMIFASLIFMLIWIAFMLLFQSARPNKKNNENSQKINNLIVSKTKPSISYKARQGYVHIPKDFVINRYLEDEKIRKAC